MNMAEDATAEEGTTAKAEARARAALILVAHGERRVAEPNRLLAGHAGALARRLAPMRVACGVLNGEPSLEAAIGAAASNRRIDTLLVYPFFMADGYFTEQALPRRLAECGARLEPQVPEPQVLAPLGLDPGLDGLMMGDALAAAADARFARDETRLLVVGHGSKTGPAAADAARSVARRLRAMRKFRRVDTAFLEEPPFIAEALKGAEGPVVISGFFAGEGMHASRDVPDAIRKAGAQAVYTGPVGARAGVRDLVASAAIRALRAGGSG